MSVCERERCMCDRVCGGGSGVCVCLCVRARASECASGVFERCVSAGQCVCMLASVCVSVCGRV